MNLGCSTPEAAELRPAIPTKNAFLDRPGPVEGLGPVASFSAGVQHALALREDGTVLAWGSNGEMQLGRGKDRVDSATPMVVAGLPQVSAVAAGGGHSLALAASGDLYGWGANGAGQLGEGVARRTGVPARIAGIDGVVAIAASYSTSAALRADGTVWTWAPAKTANSAPE